MRLLLILIVSCSSLVAAPILLKEKFAEAHKGDFFVLEQNKNFSLLYIREIKDNFLWMEEITIPATRFKTLGMSWREWIEKEAPENTLWTVSRINLQTGCFDESYSFTHAEWMDLSEASSFLTTLLNLPFFEESLAERKKIGLPPGHSKPDMRPLWNPRLTIHGSIIRDTTFSALRARWPSDGSDLSRKWIEIYLPTSSQTLAYPTYFPYWIEIEGRVGSAKLRVVDSGHISHS